MVQSLWKTGWGFLKKLRTILQYNPAIALINSKRYRHSYVYSSLFTTAMIRKQCKCPSMDGWMDEDVECVCMYIHTYIYVHTHTHTHNGILLSHKI